MKKLYRVISAVVLTGLVSGVFAQQGGRKETKLQLQHLSSLPLHMRYAATVNTLKPAGQMVEKNGTTAKFSSPDNDQAKNGTTLTIEISSPGPGDTLRTTGTLIYDVLTHNDKTKITVTRTDGAAVATYSYDGTESYVAKYSPGSDKPVVTKQSTDKFPLSYYKLKDYTGRYADALEESSDLIQQGEKYVDNASTPSLEIVYDKTTQQLHEINMASPGRSSGYRFSHFTNVDDVDVPTNVTYFEKDSSGAETLLVNYQNITYNLLTPEEFQDRFAAPLQKVP